VTIRVTFHTTAQAFESVFPTEHAREWLRATGRHFSIKRYPEGDIELGSLIHLLVARADDVDGGDPNPVGELGSNGRVAIHGRRPPITIWLGG
jgi:hypothetical protein